MRKPMSPQRSRLPARIYETLEAWAGVLLVIGAALLLYATLEIQLAHAAELVRHLENVSCLTIGGKPPASRQGDHRLDASQTPVVID